MASIPSYGLMRTRYRDAKPSGPEGALRYDTVSDVTCHSASFGNAAVAPSLMALSYADTTSSGSLYRIAHAPRSEIRL